MTLRLLKQGGLGISLVFLLTFSVYFEQRELHIVSFQGVQAWQFRAAALGPEILRFDSEPIEVFPETLIKAPSPNRLSRRPSSVHPSLSERHISSWGKKDLLGRAHPQPPGHADETFFDHSANRDNATVALAGVPEGSLEFSLDLEDFQGSVSAESDPANLGEQSIPLDLGVSE